jgi:hypothetical protein
VTSTASSIRWRVYLVSVLLNRNPRSEKIPSSSTAPFCKSLIFCPPPPMRTQQRAWRPTERGRLTSPSFSSLDWAPPIAPPRALRRPPNQSRRLLRPRRPRGGNVTLGRPPLPRPAENVSRYRRPFGTIPHRRYRRRVHLTPPVALERAPPSLLGVAGTSSNPLRGGPSPTKRPGGPRLRPRGPPSPIANFPSWLTTPRRHPGQRALP